MTVMQYKSIAVFWLLQAHYSHSFATPSLPSVLKQKSSSANVGKLYSAFLPDGFFDSGCIPMVSTVPEQYDCIFSAESTTISDSSAYLGSLSAKVDPTRLQMPLSLEARVQEDFVSFRSSSLPYFDRTHLADELRGKITASKEAIVDSIHDKVLHDFPEVPFRKEVEDFMTTSHGYRIVMGGSKPGISMVAGQSGFFTDMPISAALLQQEDISEVANEIAKTAATPVHSDISQMLTDKTDISSVSSESVSMKSMIEGLVSSAQDQSALQQIPSTAAFDHQLAQTGSIFSDITSNLFKISENMMSKNVEASASSTGAGADWMEKGNMAVQTVGAAFENKRNDIFDTSGKSIQVVADQPVHEIGKSGAQLLSKLAGGTVDSLESISHHLSQFLESLGSSLPSDLVEGTQAAIHKVVAGGTEAVLSTVNAVGDVTVREMVQSLVALVVLVVKVLFQLVSTLIAAASGKSIAAWIEETNAAIHQGALAMGDQADLFTIDFSHQSLADMMGMMDSYLHASTTYMVDSVIAVMSM